MANIIKAFCSPATPVEAKSCCKNPDPQSIFDTAVTIPAYDDDAAAGAAGLLEGRIWQTSDTNTLDLPAGVLMVKQ